jgi:hypothetical protein
MAYIKQECINSQNNRCWSYKNPRAICKVSFTRSEKAANVHKTRGLVFFKEIKSDYWVKLIPTPSFRELIEEDKTYDKWLSLQEMDIFGNS